MSTARPDGFADKLRQLAVSMAPYQEGMIASLSELCRIPSVKGPAEADAPYGRQTALALGRFLEIGAQMGFRTVNLDNRAGYVEYGHGQKLIAVLAHLDVVPAGNDWSSNPFEPVILPDRIIARGSSDDKGPLVAALYAIKALADEDYAPDARIRLIAGLDEESSSSCMEHYVQVEELPTAGFTPDASFPVINAEKGIAWIDLVYAGGQAADEPLRLTGASAGLRPNMVPGSCTLQYSGLASTIVHGKPAHASTPWEGQNAIALAMQEAGRQLAAAGCRHPFVDFFQSAIGSGWLGEGLGIAGSDESGPLTLNAGLLDLNEQSARLSLDIRYPVTWNAESLFGTIREKAAAAGVTVEIIKHALPLHFPADSALVGSLMAVYRDLTGLDAKPVAIGGGTYARSMPNIVAFGPGFPGDPETAHQAGEYILLDTLFASSAIFRQALRRLAD